MNIKDFADALTLELCRRGVDRDEAVRHIVTLIKTLTEDDIREITEYNNVSDFTELSDSLAELIESKKQRRATSDESPKNTESDVSLGNETDIVATRSFEILPSSAMHEDMTKTVVGDTAVTSTEKNHDESEQEIYLEEGEVIREKAVLTPRGRIFFIVISVLTSPLWISFSSLVLAVFGLGIAAVCLLIAVAMCLVCVEAAGGGALTLVGIIWGISRMFVGNIGIGIYEMGVGIVIGGVSLALGILTFNFAVVALPYLLRHIISFEGYCIRRIGPMLDRLREECNRL